MPAAAEDTPHCGATSSMTAAALAGLAEAVRAGTNSCETLAVCHDVMAPDVGAMRNEAFARLACAG